MKYIFAKKGFTIVEVAIVLLVISVLVVISTAGYSSMQAGARNAEAQEELASFGRVMVRYKADNGAYPATTDDFVDNYAVNFTPDLFLTEIYYNLIYCSSSPHSSYALLAVTGAGKKLFIKNDGKASEYEGATDWRGSNAATICGSVLAGSSSSGPTGWRQSGESPNGWRPWVKAGN